MRTTLTLDKDVAENIRREMKRTGKGLKEVVNDLLRAGYKAPRPSASSPFRVEATDLGITPGVDPDRINQLVDELEVTERKTRL